MKQPIPHPDSHLINEVERIFELNLVRLAELLGLNRQELLELRANLNNGTSTLQAHQQEHLHQLYLAAEIFEQNALKANYSTKHHLIGGETEFIEGLAKDPLWAVEKLIEVLARGAKQREWLENLLKDRPPTQDILDLLL